MSSFKFTFRYSAAFVRRYYVGELWRTQGGWLLGVPLAAAAGAIWATQDPELYWFSGFFAGVSLTFAIFLVGSYRRLHRQLVDRSVNATVAATGVQFDVDSVTSNAPWTQIRTVRKTAHALVLTLKLGQRPIILPNEALSDQISAFIVQSVENAGGQARDGA